MLKLAIKDHPEFEIDPREITRHTPSYMVETLESFRHDLGAQTAMTLCLGMDAFMRLPEWHAWQKILELCHLLVINRREVHETPLPNALKQLLLTHEIFDRNPLLTEPHGKIFRFDAGQYPISSSGLRHQIHTGCSIEHQVPKQVDQFIKEQGLYL